jgi:hypothetical protein
MADRRPKENSRPDLSMCVTLPTRSRVHAEPRQLPTGNTVVSYRKSATEDGEQLTIFYWTLANGVPPRHIRLAIFSYTIVERQVADAKVVAELAMLNHEIRAAVFSSSLGVLPA